MHLQNQFYTVTAAVEVMPPLEDFDLVLNPSNRDTGDFYMARMLRVASTDGRQRSIALVDLVCAGYEPWAVLEEDLLTVILFDVIVRIDLAAGTMVQVEPCDNMGGLFEIHGIQGGYIIWGEGDIFRYDAALNRVWHFSGLEILVSLKMNRHFWISNSLIHCRDSAGWHYVLDFDGTLVEEYREVSNAEAL